MSFESVKDRENAFYASLNISEVTKKNYCSALRGKFLCSILNRETGTNDVYAVVELEVLWKIYSYINLHPKNIATHRNISCALMSYIKFLNGGKRYGKRIDFAKPRTLHKIIDIEENSKKLLSCHIKK